MQAGARGLESGLVYPPGAYATQEDLLDLLKPVAETDGFYSTHIRNESYAVEEAVADALKRSKNVPLQYHSAIETLTRIGFKSA